MNYYEVPKIILNKEPVNLGKGTDYLIDYIESVMGRDPYDSSAIYFFINKRHNIIKGIQYDHGRTSIHIEKPPRGTYKWKKFCTAPVTEISHEDFEDLLRSYQDRR